ncbi:FtsX-like permease family protein [Rhodococcus oryzae]|uniref:FtsX-like permease family protein n=1 Tax=Rhodococcus oryzae TaxID=2571143 RepID=A0ABY2RM31_9NOCA|nr:FtsX-like permease family protein [Rhodococcus oryzae]TJZ77831.1 FtsX-like permease family protein [Rhodococcus oryzae]
MSATARVALLTVRGEGRKAISTYTLPVTAFAASTALLLTVLGGYGAFDGRADEPEAQMYLALAGVASVLMVVPAVTLGLAAARLGARRRDERLAALRLIGATPRQIVALCSAESGAQGLVGALIGVVGYLAAMPLVAQLRFQGRTFDLAELWVGTLPLLGVVLGMTALAALTSMLGMRQVFVSPLGVAQGNPRPAPKALIAALAAAVLFGWTAVGGGAPGVAAILIGLAVCFGVVALIGPFVISLLGRIMLARSRDAASLIAARRVLDNPKSVWRTVSGVTMASFVAAGTSLLAAIGNGEGQELQPGQEFIFADLRTGVLFTLGATFALAAISSALTQVSTILDNRQLYRSLALAGTPPEVMDRARMRQVRTPVVVMALAGAGGALLFLFPLTGAAIVTSPMALLQLGVTLAAGIALVLASALLARPVMRRVLAD